MARTPPPQPTPCFWPLPPPSTPPSRLGHRQLGRSADPGGGGALEDRALLSRLFHGGRAEHCPNGLIKHCLQAPLSQGGALQVLD